MFACVVGCGLALASAESFAAQQEQPKMPYWQDLQTVSVNREAPRTSFIYWQDLQTVSVNREAPRTSFMTYDDREAALSGKYENSRFYRLLNGTWKFLYSDSHRRLPADVTSATADLAGWCDIQVPGNWEVQGHGVAIYTNQWFEFKASDPQPPLLPDDIPVGVYRREIDIPAEWLQTRDQVGCLCLYQRAGSGI